MIFKALTWQRNCLMGLKSERELTRLKHFLLTHKLGKMHGMEA
jgi:hypothetical protein